MRAESPARLHSYLCPVLAYVDSDHNAGSRPMIILAETMRAINRIKAAVRSPPTPDMIALGDRDGKLGF